MTIKETSTSVPTASLAVDRPASTSIPPQDLLAAFQNFDQEELIPLEKVYEAVEALAFTHSNDPLATARARGRQAKQQLLFTGGQPLKTEEVAQRLRITPAGVRKKRAKKQLLGLEFGKRGYYFPAWQFTDLGVLQGLDTVLEALDNANISDLGKLQFMLSGDFLLEGKTPLQVLKTGDIELVVQASRQYGKQTAS